MYFNVDTRVKNQKGLVLFINPTDNGIQIKLPNLNVIYEDFREASIICNAVRNSKRKACGCQENKAIRISTTYGSSKL